MTKDRTKGSDPFSDTRKTLLRLVTLSACLGLAGCDTGRPTTVAAPTANGLSVAKVPVTKVVAGKLHKVRTVPVTVEPYEKARLMPKIDGYIRKMYVDFGDEVNQGDVIAELDVPELDDEVERQEQLMQQALAEVETRRAEVELAQATLKEQSALLRQRQEERDSVSRVIRSGAVNKLKLAEAEYAVEAVKASMDSAHAKVNAARAYLTASEAKLGVFHAELKKAKTMAAYATIRAPFSGLIRDRMVDPGSFVRPAASGDGTAICSLARIDRLRLVVYVSLEDAQDLDEGDRVELSGLSTAPERTFVSSGGKPIAITRIAKAFSSDTHMMRAEIEIYNEQFESDNGIRLPPGDYGMANLMLKSFDGMPTVPSSAIGKASDGGQFVVRVDNENRCSRIPVKVAYATQQQVALNDDGQIATGARIVQSGVTNIQDGMTIERDNLKDLSQASETSLR